MHMLADAQSYKNLYGLQCIDLSFVLLSVRNCWIARRPRTELEPASRVLPLPLCVIFLYDFVRTDMRVREHTTWAISQYETAPYVTPRGKVNRIYACRAGEIPGDVAQLDFTNNFGQTYS